MRLACNSTYIIQANPGKLEIKRSDTCIIFISLQLGSHFRQAIMTYYQFSCRFNVDDDVIQTVQSHVDLIKTHAKR